MMRHLFDKEFSEATPVFVGPCAIKDPMSLRQSLRRIGGVVAQAKGSSAKLVIPRPATKL